MKYKIKAIYNFIFKLFYKERFRNSDFVYYTNRITKYNRLVKNCRHGSLEKYKGKWYCMDCKDKIKEDSFLLRYDN